MRSRSILCFAMVLLASGAANADVTVIKAAHIMVDASKPVLGAGMIVVRDGKIISVGTTMPTLKPNEAVKTIDLGSRTAMPGFIDSHVHLSSDPGTPWYMEPVLSDPYQTALGTKNALLTVKAGFTTVRDVGSQADVGFALRDAINNGVIVGPRMLSSGPAISIIGGHGDTSGFRREVNEVLSAGNHNTCTGADQCAARVREAARAGADVIKITATGGVLSSQSRGLDQHFTDAELRSIVSTATTLGLKVAAHAHGPRGIESAARAGVASIEHGTFADDAALKAMKANGTYMVPTLMASTGLNDRVGKGIYLPQVETKAKAALALWGKALSKAYAMGIPIAFGTDSGVFEHGRNGEEFALMVSKGGMSPRAAIASATTGAAKLLGLGGEIGTLEVGKAADIVAVDADPLADIHTLEHPSFVMARGHAIVTPQ